MSKPDLFVDQFGSDEPPPNVRWLSWPPRESIARTVVVVLGWVLVGLVVRWITGGLHLALAAAAAMALAGWRFFVPVTFELNAEGVHCWVLGRHRRVAWNSVRSYEINSAGVLLLPVADPVPLDAVRGLFLPWGDHRADVLAQLRYYLDESRR